MASAYSYFKVKYFYHGRCNIRFFVGIMYLEMRQFGHHRKIMFHKVSIQNDMEVDL